MSKLYVKTDGSRRPSNTRGAKIMEFPELKPTSTAISLRLPSIVLARLKVAAHRRGLPYQAHIKNILAEAVEVK
jgi:predicted DNA binding CopG/RHH family protein